MSNNQQPRQPKNGAAYSPIPPASGHGGQPQFPPHAQQPGQQYGQPPYGHPGQQVRPGADVYLDSPKKGMPVWGWVACGVGALAVIAVAGVVVFNGLAGGGKDLVAAPDATASKSAAVYLFDDSDFTSAPVWSVKAPEGSAMESVKEGTVNYSNSSLQPAFTAHQAILPPTGETADEAAAALVMASEIEAVKQSVGKPVEVVTDAASAYVKLQEAELRDVV